MSVEIPECLINKLQGLGPRFIRISKHGKKPIDKGWKLHPMPHTDPKLQSWLRRGGNYGIVGGSGLIIIDIDSPKLKQIAREKLPRTFTVQSPGSGGWHLYYRCRLEKPIRLRDEDGENVGDIQGQGKMVVGPGSIHSNGGVYHILNDIPLTQITREELIEAFKNFVIPDKEIELIEEAAKMEKRDAKIELDIMQVISVAGLHKHGLEYFGGHPVHGSRTGRNFWINPSKNCWHCFRHGTGGGPLLWLAVEEGIIKCEEAVPGTLTGEVFKKVLQKARDRGLIKGESVKEIKDKENRKNEPEDILQQFLLTKPLTKEELEKYKEKVAEKLTDPSLLLWIHDVLGTRIVGEARNRLLTFLVSLSYKTDWRLALVFIAEPSAGKSWISKNVLRYFPNVVKFSRMTPKALERCRANLDNYILYIVELAGALEWMPQLRELISEGELALLSVEKNSQNGLDVKPIKTVGTPVFVSTTAKSDIEQQLSDRVFLASPDLTEEQTRRIYINRAQKDMRPPLPEFAEDEMTLRALIQLIPSGVKVLVPFEGELAKIFPANPLRGRRDFNKLMDLVKTITFLYQKQRQAILFASEKYLLASHVDLEYAFLILEDAIRTTIASLPQQALEILDAMEKSGQSDLTAKDIGYLIKKQRVTVSKYLPRLVEGGFLSCDDSKKPYKYNLVENPGTRFFESLKQEIDSFGIEKFKEFLKPLVSVSPEEIERLHFKWKERQEPTLIYDNALGTLTRNTGTTRSEQLMNSSSQNESDPCSRNKEKQNTLLFENEMNKTKSAKPVFLWRKIKPSEPCELCGKAPVQYEIIPPREKISLKRCHSCFEDMKRNFAKAEWRYNTQGIEGEGNV